MVKCPICDGRGKYANAFGVVGTCHYCKGSGYLVESGRKNMTEQEWLQTATTEQLAEKLTDFSFWLVVELPTNERREKVRNKLLEWLKQPHHESVTNCNE